MGFSKPIYYRSIPTGGGKTFASQIQALDTAIGAIDTDIRSTVLVYNTRDKIDESYKKLLELIDTNEKYMGVKVKPIYSDRNERHKQEPVIEQIMTFLGEYMEAEEYNSLKGTILLITQSAFFSLPFFSGKYKWHITIDEIPDITDTHSFDLSVNSSFLSELLEMDFDEKWQGYNLIKMQRGKRELIKEHLKRGKNDTISKSFLPLFADIVSPNFNIYADKTQFDSLFTKEPTTKVITFHAKLSPAIFGSYKNNLEWTDNHFKTITIQGANFHDKKLYKFWSADGVDFRESQHMKNVRYKKHNNGNLLNIKYLFNHRWSKNFMDKVLTDNGDTAFEIFTDIIIGELKDKEFLYSANKGDKSTYLKGVFRDLEATQLPHDANGLDAFQDFIYIVLLGAYVPTPDACGLYHTFDMEREEIDNDIMNENYYQQLGRGWLRNPIDTRNGILYVASKYSALFIQSKYPGANIEQLMTDKYIFTEPEVYTPKEKSQKETKKDYRKYAKTFIMSAHQITNNSFNDKGHEINKAIDNTNEGNKYRDLFQQQLLIDTNGLVNDEVSLFFYESVESQRPLDKITWNKDIGYDAIANNIFSELRELHKTNKPQNKEDNFLITTTRYDGSLSNKDSRIKSNICDTYGLFLDFDISKCNNDTLNYTDVPGIFSNIKMAIFNTFSAGNFRAFIPTNGKLNTITYELAKIYIVNKITNYSRRKELDSGLDKGIMHPTAIFYSPCHNMSGKQHSFFKVYDKGKRELLDIEPLLTQNSIEALIKNKTVMKTKQSTENNENDNYNYKIIKKAQKIYKEMPSGIGKRHKGYYNMGLTICKGGNVPANELEPFLIEADYDGSRQDKNQHYWIINHLEKQGY